MQIKRTYKTVIFYIASAFFVFGLFYYAKWQHEHNYFPYHNRDMLVLYMYVLGVIFLLIVLRAIILVLQIVGNKTIVTLDDDGLAHKNKPQIPWQNIKTIKITKTIAGDSLGIKYRIKGINRDTVRNIYEIEVNQKIINFLKEKNIPVSLSKEHVIKLE